MHRLCIAFAIITSTPKSKHILNHFVLSPFHTTASLGNLTLLSHESILSHQSTGSSGSSSTKKPKSKRRVSLHNDVTVLPIPSRLDYPPLIKQRLWSSATELYQNAARNSVEFASEGWNWRNVTEDEKMLLSPSGERIHPIHLLHLQGLEITTTTSTTSSSSLLKIQESQDGCQVQTPLNEEQGPVSMDVEAII